MEYMLSKQNIGHSSQSLKVCDKSILTGLSVGTYF